MNKLLIFYFRFQIFELLIYTLEEQYCIDNFVYKTNQSCETECFQFLDVGKTKVEFCKMPFEFTYVLSALTCKKQHTETEILTDQKYRICDQGYSIQMLLFVCILIVIVILCGIWGCCCCCFHCYFCPCWKTNLGKRGPRQQMEMQEMLKDVYQV